MEKFNVGDRVQIIPGSDDIHDDAFYGTIDSCLGFDDHGALVYAVLWDDGIKNSCWATDLIHSPILTQDMAPQPNTLEWWRWHYAGQAIQGFLADPHMAPNYDKVTYVVDISIKTADALVQKLTKQKP